MKVKLTVGKVINGAVWLKGTTPDVPDETAQQWIKKGEAESAAYRPAEPTLEKAEPEKGKK